MENSGPIGKTLEKLDSLFDFGHVHKFGASQWLIIREIVVAAIAFYEKEKEDAGTRNLKN